MFFINYYPTAKLDHLDPANFSIYWVVFDRLFSIDCAFSSSTNSEVKLSPINRIIIPTNSCCSSSA